MHDDDVSIDLHGGPLHGHGMEAPPVNGLPLEVCADELKIVAVTGPAKVDLDVPLGHYFWSGITCDNGHRVYEWHTPQSRWN